MNKLIEDYKEKGCRVIRLRGKDPNLLIVGENHFLRNCISPEEMFLGLKPRYFFCEGIRSGLEIDFAQYRDLQIGVDTPVADESFEKLIQEDCYGGFGCGISLVAIAKLFSRSPETKFVGMDIVGLTAKNERIIEMAHDAMTNLDDFAAEMLDLRGRELTYKQYKRLQALRDFLYNEKKDASRLDFYEATENLEYVIKNAPMGALNRSGTKALFAKVLQDTKQLNAEREETMARTMVEYVPESSGMYLAVMGSGHVRRSSRIYPVLDRSTLSYVSIDVSKKQSA